MKIVNAAQSVCGCASPPLPVRQRDFWGSSWLALILSLVFLCAPVAAQAATVWTGSKLVFSKADGANPAQAANQDRLTPNVWLTRGASQGLYNAARESSFAHSLSPADTEWASGTTTDYLSLNYADWDTWAGSVGKPPATVGVNAVLHLKTDDIYLNIKFLSWSQNPSGGGGFSYERSTAGVVAPTSHLLSVSMVGSGTVTSNPDGINCGRTCSASFNSGSNVTLTATPASGSTFAGWAGDCTGEGACILSMSGAKGVTARFAAALTFVPGWNLVGNSTEVPLTAASTFNDTVKVNSVWKWIAGSSRWAFYTPTQTDGGAAYALAKGYNHLATIDAGEGFWVNAGTAFSVPLPQGTPVQSQSFKPATTSPAAAGGSHALPSGWSLIASGDSLSPAEFDVAIATSLSTPPAAGQVYANLITLWAWDATKQNWYFWAPGLANSGGLGSYLTGKNYLDSATMPGTPTGTLSPTTGFWVNMP